jgi:hypothetical protein
MGQDRHEIEKFENVRLTVVREKILAEQEKKVRDKFGLGGRRAPTL